MKNKQIFDLVREIAHQARCGVSNQDIIDNVEHLFVNLVDKEEVIRQKEKGLSKRDLFAAMAMQGMLQNPEFLQHVTALSLENPPKAVAEKSVIYADALVKELEEK